MSAKGRGAPGIEFDNYPTPAWCVRRMLEAAPWSVAEALCIGGNWGARSTVRILEPCAGEGAIVRELRRAYPNAVIEGNDIRDTSADVVDAGADAATGLIDARELRFSSLDGVSSWDLIITNPPFCLWGEIARGQVERGRWLALLLRIGALAHCRRHGLPTPSLYVLPDRPQFVALWKCAGGNLSMGGTVVGTIDPCGWQQYRDPHESTRGQRCPACGGKISRTASDGSEYAWFVWGPQEPRVHILASTPLPERKGWRPAEAA